MRYQFEQNGSYVSHPQPSVNTDEVQNRQQTADTDMPEQNDDVLPESGEATTVDNHAAGDIPPEKSMEDDTKVDGFSHLEPSVKTGEVQNSQQIVDTDMSEQDGMSHESSEATTIDNHVAGDMPPETTMEDVTIVDGSASVANGGPTL